MNNFSFIKNRKVFFIITAVVFVIGICSFIFRGFNVDIDFVGGTTIQLELNKQLGAEDLDEIKSYVEAMEVGDTPDRIYAEPAEDETETENADAADAADGDSADITDDMSSDAADSALVENTTDEGTEPDASADESSEGISDTSDVSTDDILPSIVTKPVVSSVQKAGAGTQVIIKLLELDSESRDAVCNLIAQKYDLNLTTDLLGVTNVGASVSADLRNATILATIIATILMLIYISIRFEILSGVSAVICLIHDVFVMFAAYSILQIPLNSTMIAAVLTILGYSINATIIVFDRVRENVKLNSRDKFEDNVDRSIKQTLRRSVNTTLTTLFTIGMIYILGVDSIKQFALPIIVGIFAGLYSSVCLSGNVWAALRKVFKKKKV